VFARPTANEIWLGAPQRAALSQLSRRANVRAIVGPGSSGKTTVLQHVGARLFTNAVVLNCRGPKDDSAAVLASLLASADLAPWELSEVEQRNLLTVFVQQRHSQKRQVVLLIDDAHSFKQGALEELERLIALKIDKKPALEVVIAGPETIVKQWQEICARLSVGEPLVHNLHAPSVDQLTAYLDWRLDRFDMQHSMTPTALQMIARLSGGRYAAADILCQLSLLVLRRLKLDRADMRVVHQAAASLVARRSARLDTDRPRAEQRLEGPPPGFVVVSRGGKIILRVALGQRTLIGRSEHNDLCLPSPYLSRHHAVIVGTPEGYDLVDLNSVNGVLLNGQRVERTVLCDEDVLAIGPFELRIQLPDWLTPDSAPAEGASLSDTAILPQPTRENPALWRVK
jgi:type II secretory pathway predicted ATPase ExeA